MRIFLAGAQGTGKSTLVNSFPKRFFLEKKDSFSRKFLSIDSSIQRSESEKFEEFQDKILLHCLAEYVGGVNFISSRSIIDSYAYLEVNKAKKRELLESILDNYKKYLLEEEDIYVYLPIEFEITSDGNKNRDTDIEYQKKIDESIRRHFYRLKASGSNATFIKATGSVRDRQNQIKRAIIGIIKKRERDLSMARYKEKLETNLKKDICLELVTKRL